MLRPWTPGDGQIVIKDAFDRFVVSPPIYDTAPLRIPVLQPGEEVVIEIPWYPPDPSDFAAFGADQNHFCLLARIETSTTPPFGMSMPETDDVNFNTNENNNIAWKNITVVDDFPGAMAMSTMLIRNVFEEPVMTGLQFVEVDEADATFLDFGKVMVNLKPELFERWKAGGAQGKGIEQAGPTTLAFDGRRAMLEGIRLEPGETFAIDLQFVLDKNYPPQKGFRPAWDVVQMGKPDDPDGVVGGVRTELDFATLTLVGTGGPWRYLDAGEPAKGWRTLDFDDSDWRRGRGDLGFGNAPVTTIDAGPPGKRRIAAYFRRSFNVEDPDFFNSLYLRLRRNDGAVVYLNGKEVHRANLGPGMITRSTLATQDVSGLERDVFFPVKIDPGLLRQGRNVVAVETHLASPESADANFDLALVANPVDPRLPPELAFAWPPYGSLNQVGRPIDVQVEAIDPDGKIASVTFLLDGEPLYTDDEAPYQFLWEDPPLGTHQLFAEARDNDRQMRRASTVFSVVENTPPVAELAQPAGGTMFSVAESIPLQAFAFDDGGEVGKVEFYSMTMRIFDDPVLVATAESEPYEASFEATEPGRYMVFAVAVDDQGLTSQSTGAHIHIRH